MILGITGTNGAGKGEVVAYLTSQKGFHHYSVRDLILEEVHRRGLEPNRITIGETATDMRKTHDTAFFVRTFLERAREEGRTDVIIESIRTVREAQYLQEQSGFMIAVDAPVQLRYERISGRGSVTDNVSFEEFRAQEDREYQAQDPNDPSQMNVLGVMKIADAIIVNDSTLEELHGKVDEALSNLKGTRGE